MIAEEEARGLATINIDDYVAEGRIIFEETFNIKVNDDRIAAAIFMSGYMQACAKDFEIMVQAGIVKITS